MTEKMESEESSNNNDEVVSISQESSSTTEEILNVDSAILVDYDEKEEETDESTVGQASFPSDVAVSPPQEGASEHSPRHDDQHSNRARTPSQDESARLSERSVPITSDVESQRTEPQSPGAHSIRGINYVRSGVRSGDIDEFSGDTSTWRDPNTSSHSRDLNISSHSSGSTQEALVTATLVREEDPVVAEHLHPFWSDRRVQAAIVSALLISGGLVTWGFTARMNDTTPTHTVAPTAAPQIPGTFLGTFCSQNTNVGSFGGDSCFGACQACQSPNERLSVCLSEDSSPQLSISYCEIAQKGSRYCGSIPSCPVDHYCVECKHFVHEFPLTGQVCFPHDGDTTAERDGYSRCLSLAVNGGSSVPTSSSQEQFPTASPTTEGSALSPVTFAPTAPIQFDTPAPTSPMPPPTSVQTDTQQPSLAPSRKTLGPATPDDIELILVSVSIDNGTALNTPGSPQNMAFQHLLDSPDLYAYSIDEIYQRYTLAVLFYSTNGSQWNSSLGWLSTDDVCVWEFVGCGGRGDEVVMSIEAPSNLLRGILPPELHLLDSLESLRLDENQLSSQLPSELGLLTNLVNLTFHDNALSGGVPSEFGSLTNIEILDLDSNKLNGTIPGELGSMHNTAHLYLNNNRLSGTIPSDLGNMTMLHSLLLSSNNLTGTVPQQVCNLGVYHTLQVLSVDVQVECNCSAFADACHPVGSL